MTKYETLEELQELISNFEYSSEEEKNYKIKSEILDDYITVSLYSSDELILRKKYNYESSIDLSSDAISKAYKLKDEVLEEWLHQFYKFSRGDIFTKVDGETIELSNKVIVTDPCYKLETWCQGVLENIVPGTYNTSMTLSHEGQWGKRVAKSEIWLKGTTPDYENLVKENFVVGVDSGEAGICDYDFFNSSEFNTDSIVTFKNVEVPFDEVELELYNKLKKIERSIDDKTEEAKSTNDELEKKRLAFEIYQLIKEKKELLDCHGDNFVFYYSRPFKYEHRRVISNYKGKSIFTSTGYGDGSYACYTHRNNDGQIDGIVLDFLNLYSDEGEEE